MRAIHISSLDGPDAVEVVDLPDPQHGDLVTIEVKAAGVAFPELLQTRGLYQVKPDLPFVPGAEVAGVVTAAPEGSGLSVGDRVAALTLLGGFAEQALARPDLTFVLPDEVGFEEGASFIFNYATVYFALVERGHLARGETVLVHGAAGGIGTAAIQMAKAFGAGKAIGVVSTQEKGEIARSAGADEVVLADGFLEAVGKASVDVVVDPVGGDRFTDSLRSLREHGRLLVIGFTAGSIPEVKVNRLLLNNVSVVGVGWGAYALSRPGHVGKEWEAMLPHLRSGALRPVVGATHPLEDAAAALRSLEGRTVTGKVVLVP
ncbi:NADPH:quinone oxidoreductase family protein [Dietzia maris]|uniref:NADPH:quinone oxidoreductase family protein n=1 Tax=Dietzia maris TaxID=37915 RepID=UPI00223C4E64|nr:NADPH:quinone oxidoreductase family protein [Dietzia maris]MCT1435248.1 NADPH:quinone oxidoreductase family protein [Dietzia maris]MCT1522429.1 NADPH:quinone oxidoreductase family protein [Dietzia maris]